MSPSDAGNVGPQPPVCVIVKAALFDPVVVGLSEIMRIRYPEPVAVVAGIEILIVPEFAVDTSVPIVVALVKLPAASESCTV